MPENLQTWKYVQLSNSVSLGQMEKSICPMGFSCEYVLMWYIVWSEIFVVLQTLMQRYAATIRSPLHCQLPIFY